MRLEDLPKGVRVHLADNPAIEGVIVKPPDAPPGWMPAPTDSGEPDLDDWTDEEGCVWVLWATDRMACPSPLPYNTNEIVIPSPISALGDLVRDMLDEDE